MARTTIPSELVAINAIHGTLIADNAITAVHIATNAVSGTLIADNAVTSTHIAQNHVTGTQIAQNTITVTHIADSAVETAKINNDAVTQAKIADDAVGADQLAANAVVSASIANGTIVAADLADDAVTIAKMAALARGKIIYGDSAGNPAALALGSNGQVLTTDGTDISWGSGFNADAAQVFNESGADANFRVESNNNANMLFVDGGEDRVGIGIGSPVNDLHIAGAASTAVYLKITNGTTGNTAGDGSAIGIDADGDMIIHNAEAKEQKFYTNDTQRMTITSAGSVLIGQTSQTGYAFAEQLVVGGGTGNNNQGITVQSAQNSQGNLAFNRDNGTTAYGRISYQHGTDYMAFFTNNAERLRIDSLGNLSSAATGGHVQIDNGIGVTTRETMAASSHAWQTDTYNVLTAGGTSIGTILRTRALNSGDSSHGFWWGFAVDTTFFQVGDGSSNNGDFRPSSPTSGSWAQLVATRDGASLKQYLNGAPGSVASDTFNTNAINNSEEADLSEEVWDFVKKNKFLGMEIPKHEGGLGFSHYAHSAVVEKVASRSVTAAVSIMVPNSLGPGELIHRYGTKKQKEYFLPRLAEGKEVPAFALTEPNAGSDATGIGATGEVYKDEDGEIKIKLNWEKRYITLGPISTVLGLAFQLKDPDNLLGKGTEPGITAALINTKLPGVRIGERHRPVDVPFQNGPNWGKDVVISPDDIIGGKDMAGQGWKMLMECLGIGRCISLPTMGTAGLKMSARTSGAYSRIRRQFGLPVGKFEGVEEPLARMTAQAYIANATLKTTLQTLDDPKLEGKGLSVASAILKYHLTELKNIILKLQKMELKDPHSKSYPEME